MGKALITDSLDKKSNSFILLFGDPCIKLLYDLFYLVDKMSYFQVKTSKTV